MQCVFYRTVVQLYIDKYSCLIDQEPLSAAINPQPGVQSFPTHDTKSTVWHETDFPTPVQFQSLTFQLCASVKTVQSVLPVAPAVFENQSGSDQNLEYKNQHADCIKLYPVNTSDALNMPVCNLEFKERMQKKAQIRPEMTETKSKKLKSKIVTHEKQFCSLKGASFE